MTATATAPTPPPPRPATRSPRAPIFGIDRGPISGVAPGAWVMAYKVCGARGLLRLRLRGRRRARRSSTASTSSTSRSPAAPSPYSDPVELAFLDAYDAGVLVAASAGNCGPGAGTTDHHGPWVTTVAASTQSRARSSRTLTVDRRRRDSATLDRHVASPRASPPPTPVVLASDVAATTTRCATPRRRPGPFTGKIVACQRGGERPRREGLQRHSRAARRA